VEGTRVHFTAPGRLMATDRPEPVYVQFGRVIYRFANGEMFRRWQDAPDTWPEAWGARAIYVDLAPLASNRRRSRLRAWLEWVGSLRIRYPERFIPRLGYLVAALLGIVALVAHRPGVLTGVGLLAAYSWAMGNVLKER